MKVRLGFVSNSSTSSFLLYGTSVEEDALVAAVAEKMGKTADEVEEEIEGSYDLLEELMTGTGLGYWVAYGDCPYIGLSWDDIRDDETGAQFKQRVQDGVTKLLGEGVKCGTHAEAWHD